MSTHQKPSWPFEEILISGQAYTVISLHPAAAWAVMCAGKDVDNRSRATKQRGRVLVHASSQRGSLREEQDLRAEISFLTGLAKSELPTSFARSAILGSVAIVGCVQSARSKWAVPGQYHWLLEAPRQLATPVTGVQGKPQLWRWTLQCNADSLTG